MNNGFKAFYDTEAEVFKGTDEYGACRTAVKVIYGDLQFQSTALSDCGFGLSTKRKASLYCRCEDCDGVNVGDYVSVDEIMYRIIHIHKRKLGAKIILEETI